MSHSHVASRNNGAVHTSGNNKPLTIGVFGGSFNPIHLGHSLLAITTSQTKNVDQVVLVPVYKHAVKTDLLPFEDRVAMCQLAIAPFGNALTVSTIEKQVGASNGAMLQALKQQYPAGTRFQWICGDDFFRWMDRPKGLETLGQVNGIIVQRRLHKDDAAEQQHRFYKEPIDEAKVRRIASEMDLEIEYISGELPHFSSTLVRRAPGHWRSFLPSAVIAYLDERPHLLRQLHANLEHDAQLEQQKQRVPRPPSSSTITRPGAACIMVGLQVVHALQRERGRSGLFLSMGETTMGKKRNDNAENITVGAELANMRTETDATMQQMAKIDVAELGDFDEIRALYDEILQVNRWLDRDRAILDKRAAHLVDISGVEGWKSRYFMVEKFNSHIDVLISATVRALAEMLDGSASVDKDLPELLSKWSQSKEALGRLRAFVCSGGPEAHSIVQASFKMRERLSQVIETKNRIIARVLKLEAGMSSRHAAPEALHQLLEAVTLSEWALMRCFASSTPLTLVHKLLGSDTVHAQEFDVESFFDSSSAAIDFLLTFAKALTASACASI